MLRFDNSRETGWGPYPAFDEKLACPAHHSQRRWYADDPAPFALIIGLPPRVNRTRRGG